MLRLAGRGGRSTENLWGIGDPLEASRPAPPLDRRSARIRTGVRILSTISDGKSALAILRGRENYAQGGAEPTTETVTGLPDKSTPIPC